MALETYPALAALSADLARLEAGERHRLAGREAERFRAGMPPGVEKVEAPWLGRAWWMDGPQRSVVRMLTEALASRVAEVEEKTLMRAAGRPGVKLRALFFGTPAADAVGTLVLPGTRGGCWRLAPPPEAAEEPEARTVPVED